MKKISIMQPTFLPWPGFFFLVKKSNKTIFLTETKLEKNSRQTKNSVLKNKEVIDLIVPISGSRLQNISESIVDDNQNWRKKITKTIDQSYSKHPYGKILIEGLLSIINDKKIKKLKDINIEIIKYIAGILNLEQNFHTDTDYKFKGYKSEKIKNICNYFSIRNYISPVGAKDYIEGENILRNEKIKVEYILDNPKISYKQFKNDNKFVNNLSIIDVLANIGPDKTNLFIEKKFKLIC